MTQFDSDIRIIRGNSVYVIYMPAGQYSTHPQTRCWCIGLRDAFHRPTESSSASPAALLPPQPRVQAMHSLFELRSSTGHLSLDGWPNPTQRWSRPAHARLAWAAHAHAPSAPLPGRNFPFQRLSFCCLTWSCTWAHDRETSWLLLVPLCVDCAKKLGLISNYLVPPKSYPKGLPGFWGGGGSAAATEGNPSVNLVINMGNLLGWYEWPAMGKHSTVQPILPLGFKYYCRSGTRAINDTSCDWTKYIRS